MTDLAELIRLAIESKLIEVHTSIPGRVAAYDAATQRADVEIVIKRAEQGASGAIVHEDYPVVPNVPISWPKGGGYGLQFPLVKGDHVWLVFSESATGQWRVTREPSRPGDLARHDLSYPIAIPCDAAEDNPLPTASAALLTIPEGGSFAVSEAGETTDFVALANKVTTELERIKNDISTLKTATATGIGATMAGTNAAAKTAFEAATAALPSNPASVAGSKLRTH